MIPRPIDERFWEKVTTNSESDCWEWTSSTTKGYGQICRPRAEVREIGGPRRVPAHRYAYEKLVGPIPDDLVLDHLCRNRGCVNPDHLEPIPHGLNVLRGETVSAANKAKTHCSHGHEYTEENTRSRRKADGCLHRSCRACDREYAAMRRRIDDARRATQRAQRARQAARKYHP